jgi:hypothetical protein
MIGLIEGIAAALAEQCDFVSQILNEDYSAKETPIQMVEFYNIQVRTSY